MRYDLQIIASWIEPGAKVLDLGCGGGDLLGYLRDRKQVRGTGIEKKEAKVAQCIAKGLTVLQGDINEEIEDYQDNSFDYVILSQTLQQVYEPSKIILTMLRIGRKGIVSFPNFSHWDVRLQLLLKGHAPVTPKLPYEWYDTPNIRVITIKDFQTFAKRIGIDILRQVAINTDNDDQTGRIVRFAPNLLATYGIFLIGR